MVTRCFGGGGRRASGGGGHCGGGGGGPAAEMAADAGEIWLGYPVPAPDTVAMQFCENSKCRNRLFWGHFPPSFRTKFVAGVSITIEVTQTGRQGHVPLLTSGFIQSARHLISDPVGGTAASAASFADLERSESKSHE